MRLPSSGTSPETPSVVSAPPEPDTALTTLLEAGPLAGSTIAGRVDVVPGGVRIRVKCLGAGNLVVEAGILGTATFVCSNDEVRTVENRSENSGTQAVTVSVPAGATTTWADLVQQ